MSTDIEASLENNPAKFSTKVIEVEIAYTPPVHVWAVSYVKIVAENLGFLEVPARYYAEDQARDQFG